MILYIALVMIAYNPQCILLCFIMMKTEHILSIMILYSHLSYNYIL